MTQSHVLAPNDADLLEAQRVLTIEAEAITSLRDAIPEHFQKAVTMVFNHTGRVVITGMGKSGHVGTKLAATLSSTGTPSYFIHPSEASHGDLGMVLKGDLLIALSNSGDTSELTDILTYAKRNAIPIIGMTAKAHSTLAKMSDCPLVLPAYEEACPLGLAPTTSTTLMMALGDALAMAVLSRRGFSPEEFGRLHPGGTLGQRFKRVEDLMHTGDSIPQVRLGTLFGDALLEITQKSFGCTAVIDHDDALIGIITDGDLRRHMSKDLLDQAVEVIMNAAPLVITPEQLAIDALRLMTDRKVMCLFCVDAQTQKHILGILHMHDCIRAGLG